MEDILKDKQAEDQLDPLIFKAVKYMLVEIAEAMSNILQHILAQDKGIPVSGYIETILKARESKIISESTFKNLKPFFDFRNSLIHRYWQIDDNILFKNLMAGLKDFNKFIKEIENIL